MLHDSPIEIGSLARIKPLTGVTVNNVNCVAHNVMNPMSGALPDVARRTHDLVSEARLR
jgi:hypothetical protein